MELRSRSLLPQSERSRPRSADSTLIDWEQERYKSDEASGGNDSQERLPPNTQGGALTPRPFSPFGRDNSDPPQDNDLPLWRNSVRDPERRPQVDFEETFHNYLARSPMREPERQPYKSVSGRSAFRPVMTDQGSPTDNYNQTTRAKHPFFRAREQLNVPREELPDRQSVMTQFQPTGPYRAPDEAAVRPIDYRRLLPPDNFEGPPRYYGNRYQFNDIKPRPPSFDGKPDAWEPFLMQIQLMRRSYGWPDYKFRDQLMFALRGEALLFASNLPVHVREDTESLISAMEQRFGQCLLAETHRANLNNTKKQSRETIQQYSARVSQLMTRAYPGIQGTGIFENLAIEHLLKGLPDQKMAYEILTKKPRTLSETVDMITWHEACRQQTVKNSGVRKIEDYDYSSEYDSDDSELQTNNLRRVNGKKIVTEERVNQLWRDMKKYLTEQIENMTSVNSEDTTRRENGENHENSKKKTPYKDLTCYSCNEKAHISPECPKKQTAQKLRMQGNGGGLREMA